MGIQIQDTRLVQSVHWNMVSMLRNAESQTVRDSTYHKEKMLLCKQAEKCSTSAEEQSWLATRMRKLMNKSGSTLHYMAKIQGVPIADSGTDRLSH
ncbi:hypothetical protein Tco_0908368 [Tanacetum coccineum]|uniref:Uncharacterized protein n=1 Tax=Tanacetum coccineum TaxID=301880 RepID=A0ABQ5CQ65_9ASTR